MNDLATNPQGGEAVADDQVSLDQAAEGVDNTDAQTEILDATDGEPPEPESGQPGEAEDEFEEVERDGKTYRVPKALVPAIMKDADYTQKTQAVAADRRTLEGERQAFQQQVAVQQALSKEIGEYHTLSAQIAQYDPAAIAELATHDPGQALQFSLQRQALVEQQAALANTIGQKQQQHALEQQRTLATQIEQARATLQKEIPGWNDAVYNGLQTFGQQTYGFTAAEIGQVIDPRAIKVLHDAQQWRSHQAKTAAAAKVAKTQQTAPATTVRGASGRFTTPADTTDFAAFERLADAKG